MNDNICAASDRVWGNNDSDWEAITDWRELPPSELEDWWDRVREAFDESIRCDMVSYKADAVWDDLQFRHEFADEQWANLGTDTPGLNLKTKEVVWP